MTALKLRPDLPPGAEAGPPVPDAPPGAGGRRHLRLFAPRTHRYRPVRHGEVIAGVLLSHKAMRDQITNP